MLCPGIFRVGDWAPGEQGPALLHGALAVQPLGCSPSLVLGNVWASVSPLPKSGKDEESVTPLPPPCPCFSYGSFKASPSPAELTHVPPVGRQLPL